MTEALTLFYNWRLLSYKIAYNYRSYTPNVYDKIFKRYTLAMSKIPHGDHFPQDEKKRRSIARCPKTWAKQLLPKMCVKNSLSLPSNHWRIPRTIAGIVGLSRIDDSLMTFHWLYLLKEQAKKAGGSFDWECL